MEPTITVTEPKGWLTITHGSQPRAAPQVAYKVMPPMHRKTEKPPTVAGLNIEDSRYEAIESDLLDECDKLLAELPLLDDDPEAKRIARQRIADIRAELPAVRQTREDITTALARAIEREEADRQAAARAEQEKKTAKLARGAAARLDAAAKAYADLLRELKDDDAAWQRLGERGMSAYARLRSDKSSPGAVMHPLARASVWTLDGKCEFEGSHVR